MALDITAVTSHQTYSKNAYKETNSAFDGIVSDNHLFDTTGIQQGEKETFTGWKVSFSSSEHELFADLTGFNLLGWGAPPCFGKDDGTEPTEAEFEMLSACTDFFKQAKTALFENEGAGAELNREDVEAGLKDIVSSHQEGLNRHQIGDEAIVDLGSSTDMTNELLATLDAITANANAKADSTEIGARSKADSDDSRSPH